ncbi:MAG: AAA family ATPase [Chthoniobacterales bacterium]|nr:AAA family ATPase [Chthoniobacterales bacterium]
MALTPAIALAYLRQAQERERFAHAYLIAGVAGSGKRALAAEIAQLVNGAAPATVFAGSATDVHLAGPESKSRRIVIEQIRQLEHALQMRASAGRRKVAIISEADRMVPQAANAFLKTLEEPPNNSLLLLLTAMPEVLPDTILSRCLTLKLAAPTNVIRSAEERELIDLLETTATEKNSGSVHAAYRMAQGFQRLLAQIRADIQEENAAALKSEEARYKQTTDGAWLDGREDHYKALTESVYLQRRTQLVETLFLWWSDVLRAKSELAARELPEAAAGPAAAAARLTIAEILRRLRRLEDLRDHLGRTIQEALALEVAFLNVFRF